MQPSPFRAWLRIFYTVLHFPHLHHVPSAELDNDFVILLRLDTRDGTIQGSVPSNPKKNLVINAEPLTLDKKPGRFELYPTDSSWVWLLFDSETGNMWNVNWSAKSNVLSKIPDSVAEGKGY